jgi:pyrroloquinoline-quinone synthase
MKRTEILEAQVKGELLPETLGLQSWCAVQSTKPFVEALSGLLIGLESQVPRIYSKTTPPLLEKYGFAEDEVTFFTLHIVADTEHGERGYEIVEKYATTAARPEACVRRFKVAPTPRPRRRRRSSVSPRSSASPTMRAIRSRCAASTAAR